MPAGPPRFAAPRSSVLSLVCGQSAYTFTRVRPRVGHPLGYSFHMAANMYRYRINLQGWSGAPGLNTVYVRFAALPVIEDYQAVAELLKTAFDSLKTYYIAGVTINIDPQVDVIDDTTGTLQTSAVITPPATVTGTSSNSQTSRAQMVLARLKTDAVVNGRRLQGRLFIGPIGGSGVDYNGTITSTLGNAVSSAFSGLLDVAGGRIVVWHRPTSPGASDGTSGFVQSVGYKPVPAQLRSRRD